MNIRADVFSRNDQVNTKNIQFRRNQLLEETTLLEEIWKNNTREQKVQKKLEKENGQA